MRERQPTKHEPHGFSIERILLLAPSNCRLVGFLLRTLSFGGAIGANKYFAFRFRHREKISQPVETGCVRYGFEFGGHAGDVTGSVELFRRDSPARRVVASSRRSRGSAPCGSPISAFRFHETHLRGHPIKLSHVSLSRDEARPIPIASVECKFYAANIFIYHVVPAECQTKYVEERKPGTGCQNVSRARNSLGRTYPTCPRGSSSSRSSSSRNS